MIIIEYKVFIPSAGLGTRLGTLSKNLNKALVSVANKPAISYIIDKFPIDIEIIVALGYKKDVLKQFLELAYPERKITFIEIDKYKGSGSGLGYTILQCKNYLQCPFIFCSNDTIVKEQIPIPNMNWVGYAYRSDMSKYRTIRIKNDQVIELLEKRIPGIGLLTYIGLAGIKDYKLFWKFMEDGQNYGSITEGESFAFKKIIKVNKLKGEPFTWFDIGEISELNKAKEHFSIDTPNILPKANEAIWLLDDSVIKYSSDEEFIINRVYRSHHLKGYVPKIEQSTANLYKYRKITGQVLSDICNKPLFLSFLDHMKGFWKCLSEDLDCNDFYQTKTKKRIASYFNRYKLEQSNGQEIINNVCIPSIGNVLDKVNWNHICAGAPSTYHGDLHFENILLGEDGKFYLLDWRQDFNGDLEVGDLYYDLAKLLHGLIVSHKVVTKNQFTIDINDNIINFDIPISYQLMECTKLLEEFVTNNGYLWSKVKVITALIFLNIAVLHHDPYSKFLFYLGKYQLWQEMN